MKTIKELPMPRKKVSPVSPQETPPAAPPQPQAASEAPADTTVSAPPVTVAEPAFINLPDPPAPVVPVAPTHGEAITVAKPPEAKVRIARQNGMTAEEELALIHQAEIDDLHRAFALKLAEANNAKPANVAPKTQPISPRVAEQTRLEMEAGRTAVAKHAAEQALRQPRPVEPPASVPIFRPEDYIPKVTTGQGNIQTTSRDV